MNDEYSHDIAPEAVIRAIAAQFPVTSRPHIVVIGSLAAGYYYFQNRAELQVRTKDADCLLDPRELAVSTAEDVANDLMAHGWVPEMLDGWAPGTASTPPKQLPVVRLRPESANPWFVELLTSTVAEEPRNYIPVRTNSGFFAIAEFPYLRLTAYQAITVNGIRSARPSMLALVNLLNHRVLTNQLMSAPMGNRKLLRCSKDLGRVLAIAYLQIRKTNNLEPWIEEWMSGLKSCYPENSGKLGTSCGDGLAQLLISRQHMDEALHSCVNGLLSSYRSTVTESALAVAGKRLQDDVIVPVANLLAH